MNKNLPEYALVVAGGTGSRMQRELPKQFLEIGGKPILMHTLKQFYAYSAAIRLIVVLPENQIEAWRALCQKHQFRLFHMVVAGGATRFGSVKNGLGMVLEQEALVAVHDGVRPFTSTSIIQEAYAKAASYGNAVVAVSPKDSIRQLVTESKSKAVPRTDYKLVQTPQTFKASLLRKAYEQPEQSGFTDDASVVEQLGEQIVLVEGSYRNIKITTPEDLVLAEAFLKEAGL
ncbi:2-C-methyl-D-erythritol 4-phosphate cytidylyltransferase [Pontibacter sp. 13R65]|uniref:2-C-methyl-D-erythritol 4-phosphate cytidylyltransferase n=1 Tax=Pontibacter sp. 13R65 TaxID=3127458 RepID=UPI00301C8BB9